jgi:chromosome partitioning protein
MAKCKQRIIAISNQKGGTAKTTSAANLAAFLAKKKRNVLLIDLDAQGNLGQAFGIEEGDVKISSADVLLRNNSLEEGALEINDYLFIVPGNRDLIDADLQLVTAKSRENRLKNALRDAAGFDYVIIDCPPNLSLLTLNALTAATEVVIPVEAEYFSASGCALLEDTIEEVKSELNMDLNLSGVLITRAMETQKLHRDIIESIRDHFKEKVYKTVIPKNVKVPEAQPVGVPVIELSPGSKGAQAYINFGKEIMKQEVKA